MALKHIKCHFIDFEFFFFFFSLTVQAPRLLLLPPPVRNDAVWPDPWAAGRPQALLPADRLRLPHRRAGWGVCLGTRVLENVGCGGRAAVVMRVWRGTGGGKDRLENFQRGEERETFFSFFFSSYFWLKHTTMTTKKTVAFFCLGFRTSAF